MRSKFFGHYRPTNATFQSLWDVALIVLDTNVLLNFYSYTAESRDALFDLLEGFGERIWSPYQVAKEFHIRRCSRIVNDANRYTDAVKKLEGVVEELKSEKRHPFVSAQLTGQFVELALLVLTELKSKEIEVRDRISDDPIYEAIATRFEGRVGDEIPRDEMQLLYDEGKARYDSKTPPGFADSNKPEPDRYGDLIIWKEMIRKAKLAGRGVIFVTEDSKEDWWKLEGSTTVGPRPELLHEFHDSTEQNFYLYRTDSFVEQARERGRPVTPQVINEVKSVANEQSRRKELQRKQMLLRAAKARMAQRKASGSISSVLSDDLQESVKEAFSRMSESEKNAVLAAFNSPSASAQFLSQLTDLVNTKVRERLENELGPIDLNTAKARAELPIDGRPLPAVGQDKPDLE